MESKIRSLAPKTADRFPVSDFEREELGILHEENNTVNEEIE